jgi:hypothetical protein
MDSTPKNGPNDKHVAIPLARVQSDTQVYLTCALSLVVALSLSLMATVLSGNVKSDSACAPPESYSDSARASGIAWLQLALLVALACSLLYGPVHWNLITLSSSVVHISLSIVFVAWPPPTTGATAEALLYLTALAPGATCIFHYAVLQRSVPQKTVWLLFLVALALVVTQCALAALLWTGGETAPNLVLAASSAEMLGLPVTLAIYRAGKL